MFLNWLFRWIILGPIIRLIFWTRVIGRENLPKRGTSAIFAFGPHRTQIESLVAAACLPGYWIQFFAKSGYWEKHPSLGKAMSAIGLIPLTRSGGRAMVEQVNKGVDVNKRGGVVGIYPEATRGYDGYVHKGYTGLASISLRGGGVVIIPIAFIGMRWDGQSWMTWFRVRTIVIGEPIHPRALSHPENHKVIEMALEGVSKTLLTDHVMKEIARLSKTPYLDQRLTPSS